MTVASVEANLAGVAVFILPGLGLAELCAPLRRMAWWRRLGYAYLLGVVAVGTILLVASHTLHVPLARPAIAVAALAPAALGLAARLWRALPRRDRGTVAAPSGEARPPGTMAGEPDGASTMAGREGTALPTAGGAAGRQPKAAVDAGHQPDAAVDAGRRPDAAIGASSHPDAAVDAGHRVGAAARRFGRPVWRRAAAAVIAALCLGTLASALSVPLADWDGRMIWSPLGEWMRHERTADPTVLKETHWFVMHPRYPPLLSLDQAAVQETFGAGADEQDYRAMYVAFLAALLLVVQDGGRKLAGATAATVATLCAALPHFLHYGAGGATSAYSDLPLAAFYGAALVLLLLAQRTPARGLAAGCLLAGAVLSKNEGELLAAAALVLAAARLLRRNREQPRPRRLGRRPLAGRDLAWLAGAALPALAAAALLAAWRTAIPNRFDEDYFAALHLPELVRNAVTRLPAILHEAARLSFRWSDWQGFWVVFLAVLLAGAAALRRPVVRGLLLAGLLPLAVAWAAYAETYPLDNLGPFISETWPRFLIQGFVPLTLVFAAALSRVVHRPRPIAGGGPPASAGR